VYVSQERPKGIIMKNLLTIILFFSTLLIFLCVGCSSNSNEDYNSKDVIIQVNNSKITLEEFNDLFKSGYTNDPEMEPTLENRDKFVEYLVEKELMIQEAMQLKLAQKKNFIWTIEKFWEQTLIQTLLKRKHAEWKKKVLVTDDEIKQYYIENKENIDEPLEEVKEHIRHVIESDKLQKIQRDWYQAMKDKALITVAKEKISQ